MSELQYFPQKDAEQNLYKEHDEGYANLAKWLIGLSTGAIVFTVNLIKPKVGTLWGEILVFGLGLLIISILLGVYNIILGLEGKTYNLGVIVNKRLLKRYTHLNQEEEQVFSGKPMKVKQAVTLFKKKIKSDEDKMEWINANIQPAYLWQKRFFYIGIIAIAIVGLCSIYTI